MQNGKGCCTTKRTRISEYFVWHNSQSTFFEFEETLYSIVTLSRSSTFLFVQALDLLLPLDLSGFCPDCDIFRLFPCKFSNEDRQVPNEDRLAKRRKWGQSVDGQKRYVLCSQHNIKVPHNTTTYNNINLGQCIQVQ